MTYLVVYLVLPQNATAAPMANVAAAIGEKFADTMMGIANFLKVRRSKAMEKFFALLLTTTVLLGLSACSDRPNAQVEQFPPTVYDGTGDISAGTADRPGSSYEDRVENGRVRDSDGILSDGENAGS